MIEKPQEFTLEQKIKNCKQVIIQNMEKTLQHKMVFLYFNNTPNGQKKSDSEVKTFTVNSKDGLIKIQFNDANAARNFYDNANFRQKILLRPFNIYFNLKLEDHEMKKYFIEGVTEQKQRAIFDAARKIGICKVYTNYLTPNNSSKKMKPNGVLSFIRKEELSEKQFKSLEEDLRKEQVKISPYISEKGLKCTIKVFNFFTGDLKKEDAEIIKQAEQEIRNLVKPLIKNPLVEVNINVKRREEKVYVTALLDFANNDQAMDNFEQIRKGFVEKGQIKAFLNYHNHEANSYVALITSGLQKKDQNMSDKVFEEQLIQTYRKVNPGVTQVNIFPVKFNNTFIGRVYLRSEDEGKNFIVDYVTKREDLVRFYKDNNKITFNINVDNKTLKKIKQAQRKANQIARGIKNSQEAKKKSSKLNQPAMNQIPLINVNLPPFGSSMGPIGLLPSNPLMNQNKGMMPPIMGMPSNIPPMGGMMNGPPPMGGMVPETNPKTKLEQAIKDKDKFLKMQPYTARRLIGPSLKYVIEQAGVPKQQIAVVSERLLKEDLLEVFKCLENQDELKKRIGK